MVEFEILARAIFDGLHHFCLRPRLTLLTPWCLGVLYLPKSPQDQGWVLPDCAHQLVSLHLSHGNVILAPAIGVSFMKEGRSTTNLTLREPPHPGLGDITEVCVQVGEGYGDPLPYEGWLLPLRIVPPRTVHFHLGLLVVFQLKTTRWIDV